MSIEANERTNSITCLYSTTMMICHYLVILTFDLRKKIEVQ